MTESNDRNEATGTDPVADAVDSALAEDTCDEAAAAAPVIRPATRHAFSVLMHLEAQQAELRERATAAAEEATAIRPELEDAEAALERAQAAEIVSPSDETAAAAAGAQARVDDLTDAKAKHTRACNVLEAEATRLDDEIAQRRRELFEAATSDLEVLQGDAVEHFKARLADLVPELRREAQVLDMLARLRGGMQAAFSFETHSKLRRIEEALEMADEMKTGWRGELSEELEELRGIAAYAAPNGDVVPPEWVADELRERFRDRNAADTARRELTRQEGIRRQEQAQRDYARGTNGPAAA
jgi:small-conductance mechanosensitive channel